VLHDALLHQFSRTTEFHGGNAMSARPKNLKFAPQSVDNLVLIGSTRADTLIGGSGDDSISAGNGNDLVLGGAGRDTLLGGAGNDAVSGDAGNDSISGGAGDDSLAGGLGDDVVRGDAGNDVLLGGAGSDTLLGGAGDDTIAGGAGADSMDGGTGRDFLDYSAALGAVCVNLGESAKIVGSAFGIGSSEGEGVGYGGNIFNIGFETYHGFEGTDRFSGFEGVIGSQFSDVLYGTTGSDTLIGGDGNDLIQGGRGLAGRISATGADNMQGGAGDDSFVIASSLDHSTAETIDGGSGNDTIFFTSTTAGQTLRLSAQVTDPDNVINVTITDPSDSTPPGATPLNVTAAALSGSLAVNLTGNAGVNVLVGSASNDTLTGGTGQDNLSGGEGADTFVFAAGDTASPTTYGFDTITDYTSGTDIISATGITKYPDSIPSAPGTAGIANLTAEVTFDGADDTLDEKIAAVANAMGGAASGCAVVFQDNGDSYVFITDGSPGADTNDIIIKLVGVSGTELTVVGNTITSVTSSGG